MVYQNLFHCFCNLKKTINFVTDTTLTFQIFILQFHENSLLLRKKSEKDNKLKACLFWSYNSCLCPIHKNSSFDFSKLAPECQPKIFFSDLSKSYWIFVKKIKKSKNQNGFINYKIFTIFWQQLGYTVITFIFHFWIPLFRGMAVLPT